MFQCLDSFRLVSVVTSTDIYLYIEFCGYKPVNSALPVFDPFQGPERNSDLLTCTGLLSNYENDILVSHVFVLCRPYILISYITFDPIFIITKYQTSPKHLKQALVFLREYCLTSQQTWKDLVVCPRNHLYELNVVSA